MERVYGIIVQNNPINSVDPDGLQAAVPGVAAFPMPLILPPVFVPGTKENKAFVDSVLAIKNASWPWTRENTVETIEEPDGSCNYPEYNPGPGGRFKMCITFCKARYAQNIAKRSLCYAACSWGAVLEGFRGTNVGK